MSTLTDFVTGAKDRVRDEEGKLEESPTKNEWEDSVQDALKTYNKAHPRIIVEDIPGSGTYKLDLPATWEYKFSKIVRIDELQGTTDEEAPQQIAANRYLISEGPLADEIYRTLGYFTSGTDYRVSYTVKHTITAQSSSVPSGDESALMDMAASEAALRLAAAYAQLIDQSIGTEVINFKDKYDKYKALSKELKNQYHKKMKTSRKPSGQKVWQREQTLLFHD